MFKPERMSLLQIVVLDDDVIPVCDYLVKQRVVHLVDRSVVAPALREGTPAYFSSVQADIETISEQLHTLSAWLRQSGGIAARADDDADLTIDPQNVCEDIKPQVTESITRFSAIRKERDEKKDEINRLTRISDALQSFETAGISYGELSEFRFFAALTGTMPRRYLPDLRRSLQQIPYHLELRTLSTDEASLIVLCPKDVLSTVRGTLKSLYFSSVAIPTEYQEDPRAALDLIELRVWQLREEVAALNHKLNTLCAELAPRHRAWERLVKANMRVLNAMQLFGKTARTTFISGWVPQRQAESVTRGLGESLDGRVSVELSTPDAGLARQLKQQGKIRVPTKFRHPAFLKPFEGIVTTYGYPDYDGIDPTFFVAVTFLLMFGMMFGDIGHGLCLAGIGLVIVRARVFRSFRQAGWLLVAAGCSAMVFGLLFGSVFGVEFHDLALWMLPLEHVPRLLASAVIMGICVITLGIALNIIQSVKTKNFREAFFGQWGLLSGCFYWMTLGVFFITLVRDKEIPVVLTIAVLLVPIVLVVLGDIFYSKLFERRAPADDEHAGNDNHSVAETIFKPVEITLGFVTNTISFVRVGAFALNHAALMMVVYIIAEMGGGFTGAEATFNSRLSYIIAAITGNIFVMALEGLVVFIQCLRLEYYEFFSKFFKGEGIKFEPLQVEDV